MKDVEKGSVKGEVVFVTDILKDLSDGAEAMLQEPYGCFEQTSSTTFPNILVLQLLQKSGRSNPRIEKRALELIDKGYKRLAGFEVKSGGFDWFGNPPSHEALTAFGLIEFFEMQKVYSKVDADMIERTRKWLLSRRNGDGTFHQLNHGLDNFSATKPQITDAYIVYALSETGVNGIDAEYNHSLADAVNSKDMYVSALMANAAINYQKTGDYKALKSYFATAVATDGIENLKINTSFTNSYGRSLVTETVALWTLALMKETNPDFNLILKCTDLIRSRKAFGMYGSTQATYLSLKVVTEFYNLLQAKEPGGDVNVMVNRSNVGQKHFTKGEHDNIVIDNFSGQLKEGNNSIDISLANTNEPLPFTVDIKWNSKTPQSNKECMVKIETTLTKSAVPVNETVRLGIKVTNTTQHGIPMSIAMVGIPAGLSLQSWQLKELKEKEKFDFYEIINDKLVIYYRGLGPSQSREVNLDLKADVPGSFLSAASCAYLYYTDEFKHWAEGTKVTVY
jgi:uncharacterized protein YfaS (alpha-2-macroglobulin family)